MSNTDQALISLVENPGFRAYVLGQEGADVAYWQGWLERHPEQREVAQEAAAIIHMLEDSRSLLSQEEVAGHWEALQAQLAPAEEIQLASRRWWLPLLLAAALALLLALAGTLGYWQSQRPQERGEALTAFGEIRQLVLPDGSEVVLNANSSLRYFMPVDTTLPRQVWVTGEAYFEVTHQPLRGGRRFWVHSKDLVVKVMGTAFNVNNRGYRNEVLLDEGKVSLQAKGKPDTLDLRPGQLASYDPARAEVVTQEVNARRFVSWKENQLIFDQTTVAEIADWIWDQYGVAVVIESPALKTRELSGEATIYAIDDLILILKTTFRLKVSERDGSLYFE